MPADAVPVTRKEQALWMLELLVPGTSANNLSVAFAVVGRLDPGPLRRAVDLVVGRHPALRTVFHADGAVLTKRTTHPRPVALAEQTPPLGDVDGAVRAFALQPYGWDGAPMLRAGLFHGPGGDVFCLGVHHAVFDVASGHFVLAELTTAYDAYAGGREPVLEPVADDPATPDTDGHPAGLAYWQEHLRGYEPDRRGPAGDGIDGAVSVGAESAEAKQAVRRLQKDVRAPEGTVLIAAFALLAAQRGAGHDLVIGVPTNVRGRRYHPRAVGYHVNVLTPRLRIDPADTFRRLARQARDVYMAALGHADASVEELLPGLLGGGSPWRTTLFRYMFNYMPGGDLDTFTIGGHPARQLLIETGCAKTDLELAVRSVDDWLQARVVYHTGAFTEPEVLRLVARYERLLADLADHPDDPMGDILPAETPPARAAAPLPGTADTPPDAELVEAFVGLWGGVLGRDDLTPDSNFFLVGGVSLLAAVLIQRIRDTTGARPRLADLFHAPTPAGLASRLTAGPGRTE